MLSLRVTDSVIRWCIVWTWLSSIWALASWEEWPPNRNKRVPTSNPTKVITLEYFLDNWLYSFYDLIAFLTSISIFPVLISSNHGRDGSSTFRNNFINITSFLCAEPLSPEDCFSTNIVIFYVSTLSILQTNTDERLFFPFINHLR